MAVRQTAAGRMRNAGEAFIVIPSDGRRCGHIAIEVTADQLPGDPDRDFLTLITEYFDGTAWVELARATASGRIRPTPISLTVSRTNADGYPIPFSGDVRARVVTKRPARFAIAIEKSDDPGDPPPLREQQHSVAHDGEANIAVAVAFLTSVTATGKTTAGSERCGVLHFGVEQEVAMTINTPTWGASAMTEMGTGVSNEYDPGVVEGKAKLYRFVAPPTGATDVTITTADEFARGGIIVSSYSGVDQTTPLRASSADGATGAASTPTVTCDPSATGDMVVDALWRISPGAPSPGAGQTSVGAVESTGGSEYWGAASREAGAATVVMSWTTSDNWALMSASLQASGGSGSAPAPNSFETATVTEAQVMNVKLMPRPFN